MLSGSVGQFIRRAGAITVAAALFATTPVFAAPTSSAVSTSTPSRTDSSVRSLSSSGQSTTQSTREPVTEESEISVGLDRNTVDFRDKLASKQDRLDAFEAQLYELDRELEVATEEYNAAVDQLAQMKATVEVAAGDLEKAKTAFEIQTDILGDRAATIYKDGSLNIVEVLLGADSMADFITRVKFLNTMGVRDADIAASLRGQKTLLADRVGDLEGAQAAAESLEFELKARQIEIMLRIQERQAMLAEAQEDLLELLDSEAARRQAAQSQLLAEILSGASDKGIVVKTGSPVETALAYHGVPYLWGGETPSGFDCSGLVLYVFAQHSVTLPHYSGSQFRMGQKVAASAMVAGDVVFFGSPIHHVGIYMGGGYYLHAPRTGDFVKISKLADRSDFAGARRYDWIIRTKSPKNAVKSTNEALSSYGGGISR